MLRRPATATSSAATTGLHVEVVTVSATQVVLRSDATHTAGARAAATFTAPTVAVGYLVDSTSGFDDLTSALISGVAVVPGVMAMADAILTEQARCIVTCFVYAYGVVDAVW